jgi:hypothetical protein
MSTPDIYVRVTNSAIDHIWNPHLTVYASS